MNATNISEALRLAAPQTFHPHIDALLDAIIHALSLNQLIPDHSAARLSFSITLAVTFATLVFITYHFLLPSAKRGNVLLIAGPSNTGKTVLFYQLNGGKKVIEKTYTSMKENDSTFTPVHTTALPSAIRVIDFPGHPSLRYKLNSYVPIVRSVVFVVTSSSVSGNAMLTTTASLLFDILSHPLLQQRRVPVLVLINQQSITGTSVDVANIQSLLESALDSKRKLHHSMPDLQGDVEGEGANVRRLGLEDDGKFHFSHSNMPVELRVWSGNDSDVKQVSQWIERKWIK